MLRRPYRPFLILSASGEVLRHRIRNSKLLACVFQWRALPATVPSLLRKPTVEWKGCDSVDVGGLVVLPSSFEGAVYAIKGGLIAVWIHRAVEERNEAGVGKN